MDLNFFIGEKVLKNYKVKVNENLIETQKATVSAFPLNRVWTGAQRVKEQTEEAYFVSFDLLEKKQDRNRSK